MVKAKVTLTQSVTVFVEGESEDSIQDWMNSTTPAEAIEQAERNGSAPEVNYSEDIVCYVRNDSDVDIHI